VRFCVGAPAPLSSCVCHLSHLRITGGIGGAVFAPLDHFNKAMYHIPSFALLALSAIIFYRLRWYAYYDQDPWAADRDLLELSRHLRILFGIAIVLLFIGGIFLPGPL
jgi:hypothetical protein